MHLARLRHDLWYVLHLGNGILDKALEQSHLDALSDGVRDGKLDEVVARGFEGNDIIIDTWLVRRIIMKMELLGLNVIAVCDRIGVERY